MTDPTPHMHPESGTATTYPPEFDRRRAPRRVASRRLGDEGLGPKATMELLAVVLERESRITREPLTGDSFLTPGWENVADGFA